ncbi:MAG: SH3 domain-containing protein [Candidatus Promineifilaceae bacterium]
MQRVGIVTADHAARPGPVLAARAGDKLRRGRRDTEWPGWIWCENEEGVGGWAPESFLEGAGEWVVLRRDYDATELSVSTGERLLLGQEVLGWWWAKAESGEEGWVPAGKITVNG